MPYFSGTIQTKGLRDWGRMQTDVGFSCLVLSCTVGRQRRTKTDCDIFMRVNCQDVEPHREASEPTGKKSKVCSSGACFVCVFCGVYRRIRMRRGGTRNNLKAWVKQDEVNWFVSEARGFRQKFEKYAVSRKRRQKGKDSFEQCN